MTNNNYHKVLLFLKQFEGDGKFHEIESLLSEIENATRQEIFVELAREGLIDLEGGRVTGLPLMYILDDRGSTAIGGSDKLGYDPYRGKIKFKGSKYLKEEIEMTEKGKYNIKVEGNSTANVIIGSPCATINNKTEIVDKLKNIIETIENDKSLNELDKKEAIETFTQLETEITNEKTPTITVEKIMTVGAKISSIGSLVVALTRLLLGI